MQNTTGKTIGAVLTGVAGLAFAGMAAADGHLKEPARLVLQSPQLDTYNYVPLVNTRKVRVSVYTDADGCPNLAKRRKKSGMIHDVTLKRKKASSELSVPANAKTYVRVTESRKSAGTSVTCQFAVSFQPQSGATHVLDMSLQQGTFGISGGSCGDPGFVVGDNSTEPAEVTALVVRDKLIGGVKVEEGYCVD